MTDHVSPVPKEARPYQGLHAGLASRLVANTIDGAIVVATLIAGYLAVCAIRFLWQPATFHFPAFPRSMFFFLGSLVAIAYFTLAWSGGGRTYGDYVMGLRVVNRLGTSMGVLSALVRAAFCVVFPIGLLWAIVSRKNLSVQDIIVGTSVIYDWLATPSPEEVPPPSSTR